MPKPSCSSPPPRLRHSIVYTSAQPYRRGRSSLLTRPRKRTGAFSRLDPKEQGAILREHGTIGRQYGAQDLAHDIRLACHGLDTNDNDFVIGLIGSSLYPLSHVVQSMRKTKQTGEYMEHMGPFFVGRVIARIPG